MRGWYRTVVPNQVAERGSANTRPGLTTGKGDTCANGHCPFYVLESFHNLTVGQLGDGLGHGCRRVGRPLKADLISSGVTAR
jgi:hypothetical protein